MLNQASFVASGWTYREGGSAVGRVHTNDTQPNELERYDGPKCYQDPPRRLCVERNPKEPAIRLVARLAASLGRLKDPFRVAGRNVDLVPPAQSHQSPSGNVLEVVEVGGEQEAGEDED